MPSEPPKDAAGGCPHCAAIERTLRRVKSYIDRAPDADFDRQNLAHLVNELLAEFS